MSDLQRKLERQSIELLKPYVPGRPIEDVKSEFGLSDVVKIASNENPLGCSPRSKSAITTAIENVSLYPDGNCTELRNCLAEHLSVAPGNIVFGAGADEVISMLAQAFIEEGDEMITGQVTFSQYAASVDAIGGKTVYVPMKDHCFDLDGILNAITGRTKLIFIANPNNPTGLAISTEAIKNFIINAPKDILLVFDEAYCEYVDTVDYPDTISLIKDYPNVVVLRTFSKIYGLASLRVGFGVMDESIVESVNKIRKPFNVSIPAQMAAIAALEDSDFVALSFMSNQNTKKYLYGELNRLNINYIPSQANFVMIDTGMDSTYVFNELMKRGFIIRAGAAFGMDTYIRVTVGTLRQMKSFIVKLIEVLEQK